MSRRPFDAAAAGYDRDFTSSVVGRLQRTAVRRYLESTLHVDVRLSILDVGCGTGEDAVHFAGLGHRVTAVDVSVAMLEQTRTKIRDRGLDDLVSVLPLDLADPAASAVGGPFDVVLSNFGALNCVDLEAVARLARWTASRTNQGATVILVVMPRACAWEFLYFLGRGRPASALRRRSDGPVEAPLGDETVTTWYHGIRPLIRCFAPEFTKVAVVPIGFAVPPSYLEPWAKRHPRTLRLLAAADRLSMRVGPLAGLSDHALIHLERR